MSTGKKQRLRGAVAFITLMGVVSLFSDMTHEGARSILGEYLNLAGASGAAIGCVSGVGDLFSTYRLSFAVLGIPALITIALVVLAKVKYPHPEMFEKAVDAPTEFHTQKSFVLYMAAICLFAFGFADFSLFTLHAARTEAFPTSTLSLLYAAAMAVDAFAALFFGWLFDKIGLRALMLSTLCSAFCSCCIFLSGVPVLI